MKVRTREINIISMSALDMFCSALGAFMFLALLFIPFVPNLGPEAQELVKLEKQVETLREQLEKTTEERDAARSEIQKGLAERATDIAIVIDTTGSMKIPIEGLRKEIGAFANILGKLSSQARISIIDYEDRCAGTAARSQPLTAVDPGGLAQLQAFANSLKPVSIDPASGLECADGQLEEELHLGVEAALALDWKALPKNQFIIVIGDQAARSDMTEATRQMARSWSASGAHLSTLRYNDDANVAAFYEALARDGNGAALIQGESFALSLLAAMSQ